MMRKNTPGFTIVELLVVATIIAILSTIGFFTYTDYLLEVRDTSRIAQLDKIRSGLQSYATSKKLPYPDDYVTIQANGTDIGYQGYAGQDVLDFVKLQEGGKDPLDKEYYTYYVNAKRTTFQLMAYLEESTNLSSFLPQASAAGVDYSGRVVKVTGLPLGTLTESGTQTPVQEISTIVAAGLLDIGTTTDSYVAHLKDSSSISGTGGSLVASISNASCKRIKDLGLSTGDGGYTINPDGSQDYQVYCDMTTDGGGWTLFAYHEDNHGSKTETTPVIPGTFGFLSPTLWKLLKDNYSHGLMFKDEHGNISKMLKTNLELANCDTLKDNFSSSILWLNEDSGCDTSGGDYTMINMREDTGGHEAALYQQSTMKFDVWPYIHQGYSYDEQDELYYFIK